MKRLVGLMLVCSCMLSSCIEIIDDLTLNLDGSGTFKYTINLSSSKVKVNSILALDSFNGKKVPKIDVIETKFSQFSELLKKEKGIISVQTEFNKVDFIVKIAVGFSSVQELQNGVTSVIQQLDPTINITQEAGDWIQWDGKTLQRIIPKLVEDRIKSDTQADNEFLKTGSYTCISRLPHSIQTTSNELCRLNPAKSAAMLRVNALELKLNPALLKHTLTTAP